jgi:uncharacterized protein (TIGR04222 family)
MLDDQHALYQRLLAFPLDDPSQPFGFLAHLMGSNGWDRAYALRAMEEYKKFVFLALVTNHQVTPSDQVDQVWHLHLLFTDAYWNDFCPRVLGRPLHHHPAKGGREERERFHHQYRATLTSYQRFFGTPPVDLWPPADVRFGSDLQMRRGPIRPHGLPWPKVDWSAPAKGLLQPLALVLALAVALALALALPSTAMARAAGSPASPPSAGVAPIALAAAPALVWASGRIVRPLLRPPSPRPQEPELDLEQLAYLARGARGALQVSLAKLVQQGVVHPHPSDNTLELVSFAPRPGGELERQLVSRLRQSPSPQAPLARHTSDLMALRHYDFKALRHALRQKQLMLEPCSLGVAGLIAAAIVVLYPILFPFPWAGVIGLLCGGLVAVELLAPGSRSRWGDVVVERHRRHVDHYDPLGRVALLGPSALSGGAMDDLRTLLAPAAGEQDGGGCGGCGC